jgi:pentapeptide repeat protein
MASPKHLQILKQGVKAWAKWRTDNKLGVMPLLDRANLSGANLSGANLSGAKLMEADLSGTDLSGADLRIAQILAANLSGANLSGANLSGAILRQADLRGTLLLETNFEGTDLTGSFVYGISAWDVKLAGATQLNLVITPKEEPVITVDNLEVAQFIYLLLHNQKIREVIDTITSKAVLILGRFTPERKAVLDTVRDELRHRNYLPIVFDFEQPTSRDLTETISTLAHLARFIIADITDAKSIPQELERIVPDLPSVPVQPILLASAGEYGMFEHFRRYPWVLEIYQYESPQDVITSLTDKVIAPAEVKAKELLRSMRRDRLMA